MKKEIDIQKSEKKGHTVIHKMVVPEEHRGKGIGSKHLKKIIEESEKKGKVVALSPSEDFGGKLSKLKKFYKSHGFIENKGKKKDFEISESYYKPIKKKGN